MKIRDLINIIEAAQIGSVMETHSSLQEENEIDFDDWFDTYGLDVAEGSGILDDLDEDEPSEDDIRDAVADRFYGHLEKVSFDMVRKLYRGMTVSQQHLNAIIRGEGSVGIHWSTDYGVAVRFSGEGDGEHHIVITATAPASSVDVGRSIYLSFINYEEEDEIRLKPHSPVMVHEIGMVDHSGRIFNVQTVNKNISTGPDLYGSPYEQ